MESCKGTALFLAREPLVKFESPANSSSKAWLVWIWGNQHSCCKRHYFVTETPKYISFWEFLTIMAFVMFSNSGLRDADHPLGISVH